MPEDMINPVCIRTDSSLIHFDLDAPWAMYIERVPEFDDLWRVVLDFCPNMEVVECFSSKDWEKVSDWMDDFCSRFHNSISGHSYDLREEEDDEEEEDED